MSDEIHVDEAVVGGVIAALSTAAEALSSLDERGAYRLSPEVVGAHDELARRWDERRAQLAEGLGTSSTTLQRVLDAFRQTDEDLAASLASGGGTPS